MLAIAGGRDRCSVGARATRDGGRGLSTCLESISMRADNRRAPLVAVGSRGAAAGPRRTGAGARGWPVHHSARGSGRKPLADETGLAYPGYGSAPYRTDQGDRRLVLRSRARLPGSASPVPDGLRSGQKRETDGGDRCMAARRRANTRCMGERDGCNGGWRLRLRARGGRADRRTRRRAAGGDQNRRGLLRRAARRLGRPTISKTVCVWRCPVWTVDRSRPSDSVSTPSCDKPRRETAICPRWRAWSASRRV